MNIYAYEDIRTLLKDELNRRSVRNPKYSMRKFAEDLKISFSRLSELLNFRKGNISRTTLQKIGMGLQLSPEELDYFYLISIANRSSRPQGKTVAVRRLEESSSQRDYKVYKSDFGGLMQKWYNLALIELVTMDSSCRAISESLGVPESEIEESIEYLVKHKYLERKADGTYSKLNRLLKIESNIPSAVIQQYHIQMAGLAKRALQKQPIQNRKFVTSVISFEKKYLAEARSELENFMMQFTKKYISANGADSVYCAGMQFFEINHKEEQ